MPTRLHMAIEADDVVERRAEHLEAIVGRRIVILLVEVDILCDVHHFCNILHGSVRHYP